MAAVREDAREAIGIDAGVKAQGTPSNGVQFDSIRMLERRRKKLRLARAERQSKARRKKRLALARGSRRMVRQANWPSTGGVSPLW